MTDGPIEPGQDPNPDDGGASDPEWQQFLISQLPNEVREKFEDPRQAEEFFQRIDRAMRPVGLVFKDAKLAVDPTSSKAYVQVTAEIDPAEDKYQQDKELRNMMYDSAEAEMERQMEEIRADLRRQRDAEQAQKQDQQEEKPE